MNIKHPFFFLKDAWTQWPIVGKLLPRSLCTQVLVPLIHLEMLMTYILIVFRVLGLINACILCLIWFRFCFYCQYSSIDTLTYWLRTPNHCQIQHSLPASQIILRKLPLLTHAVTRPRHGSRVHTTFFSIKWLLFFKTSFKKWKKNQPPVIKIGFICFFKIRLISKSN